MKKILSYLVAALFCTSISAQQLNESFEGESFPPEDWSVIDGYPGYGWKKAAKFGQNCAMIQEVSGTESWLITPQLRPANGESLKFSACIGDYASSGQLRIEVSLGGTDAGSFELLDTYYTSQSKGDAAHRLWKSEWKEYTLDLSAYRGQAIYIGFHQTGSTDRIYLDNVNGVSIVGNTSCENPSNIVLGSLTSSSATFTWQGTASQYQYVLVEKGEEVDWSAATTISAKTVTLSNLYEETEYEFYVRSYCSADEQSLAPKTAFKTPCTPFDVPWIETFTRDQHGSGFVVVEPDCWTVATSGTISIVADKTYDDEGNASTVNGQAHLQVIGGGAGSEQVFAMPTFNAPLNTLEVAFDYKTNMATDYCGQLEVGYMTNPNKASTFVSLQTLERTMNYTHVIVPLNDLPASAMYIAFRFAGGTSSYGTLAMDNFVVAEIGHSGEVDPSQEDIPDPAIYGLSYCEAQFTWYSYNNSAFAIGLADAEGNLIAGILATTGECDRFAYQDGVGFDEDDDYENHYYCSTKWILNADEEGMQRGDGWNSSVINIGTATSPVLGLRPGTYQVMVYALVQNGESYSRGELLATIPFTLVSKEVTNLAATVAEDKTSATLTWDAPEFGQGERLYVRVWSGEIVAYDNFDSKERPASPLTVSVIEGKSYNVTVQVVDKNNNPLGQEVSYSFTVGVNSYEPANPHAEVFGGDNVTFSWEAATQADRYVITLFWNGEFYSTLVVNGTSKTTTMPKDGTWTWTIQAFNQGSNGNYFEASNAVAGNEFVSKAADIPEDAIELDVIGFNAYYIEPGTRWYQEGKNGWVLQFGLGTAGYSYAWFLAYTNTPLALSGMYNTARGNLDEESIAIFPTSGSEIIGTEADVRLQFDGYDEVEITSGYSVTQAFYTGSFRLVGTDGKTYVGRFMELMCSSGDFTNYASGNPSIHITLTDEDPDYIPYQSVENIVVPAEKAEKILHEGQLYIVRPDGAIYNATGIRVK